jgi:hypothetical protein
MSAPTRQAAPKAKPAPAAQAVPNQYHLQGHGISVAYYPKGFGPIQKNGPLRLVYRDNLRTLAFHGDEVRVVAVPDLGTVVSVTIIPSIDTGPTDFSLVVPEVVLALADSSVPIETFGVTTMHHVLFGAIGPQRETYTVTKLSGSAAARALP